MTATKGRPTKWTDYEYYRLWEFVTYYRRELKQSVRRACQYISEREPWCSTGLSPATLRRRYGEAVWLRSQGKLGKEQWWTPPLDFNFALTMSDMQGMMGPGRYRAAMDEWWRGDCPDDNR
jgi:hypothetical protein